MCHELRFGLHMQDAGLECTLLWSRNYGPLFCPAGDEIGLSLWLNRQWWDLGGESLNFTSIKPLESQEIHFLMASQELHYH